MAPESAVLLPFPMSREKLETVFHALIRGESCAWAGAGGKPELPFRNRQGAGRRASPDSEPETVRVVALRTARTSVEPRRSRFAAQRPEPGGGVPGRARVEELTCREIRSSPASSDRIGNRDKTRSARRSARCSTMVPTSGGAGLAAMRSRERGRPAWSARLCPAMSGAIRNSAHGSC